MTDPSSADIYIVFTYNLGVLGGYRTQDGAETAARVISNYPPYRGTDIKVARINLNELIDVSDSNIVRALVYFVYGERKEFL